ncbi:expressed unknown protein [Seminavis robusta]|uniref:Fe2OG dioxygenase domain-containing protein n=1 Tax=Seminavis robusta TaxID=568900 RepID=A0A9N8EFK3_9STRA|nr:expressed unknown protein [Seminavis robusta]|eukprot:Sro918_g220040.1 n/a (473) ;mRNA; f:30725-32143
MMAVLWLVVVVVVGICALRGGHHDVVALSISSSVSGNKRRKIRMIQRTSGSDKSHHHNDAFKSLSFALQKCTTPSQVLQSVGIELSPSSDPDGRIASLVLVRLSKQLMTLQNEFLHPSDSHQKILPADWKLHVDELMDSAANAQAILQHNIIPTLTSSSSSSSSIESLVEGTKCLAVLARLMPHIVTLEECCQPVLDMWKIKSSLDVVKEAHHLSGLQWAFDCFHCVHGSHKSLPDKLQARYDACNLPFRIRPGRLLLVNDLTVANLVAQVPFQVDAIRTTSTKQVVRERRETAWLGDDGVDPFAYSGKSMERHAWSPLVKSIRDELATTTETHDDDDDDCGKQTMQTGLLFPDAVYYDGCLLNMYPDGGSAMRYHMDPDQGVLWDYNTAVVSVGASRRVAFRRAPSQEQNDSKKQEQPHTFVVMHGDVMEMVADCQTRFQHTVKPADYKQEKAARASLVFKRTLALNQPVA